MAFVKGLRRQLDFYYYKGKQVVRSWPKKSNLIPTPAQKIQRDNFRAIECCLKSQGSMMRRHWQLWSPPVGQTWVDYVHRVWMAPAFQGLLLVVPDFIDLHVQRRQLPQFSTLEGGWDVELFPNPAPLDIVWTPATPQRKKWKWQVFDHKVQRGKLVQPRWAPVISPWRRAAPVMWDVQSGRASWRLVSGIDQIAFAFWNHEDPSETAQLSACIYSDVTGPH